MLIFLEILAVVFIAEMGDKTQFLMIAMASKYKVRDIIIGVGLAILVLNALAIGIGALIGNVIPTMAINFIAGLAFLYFALSAIGGDDGEEEKVRGVDRFGAMLTVFGTFFLAELGDKTQLTALTLAAENGLGQIVPVFLGASLGLFAADMIGFVIGYFLGKKLPSGVFNWISFAIFAVFGATKLFAGFEELFMSFANQTLFAILLTSALMLIFVGACVAKLVLARRKREKADE